MRAWKSNKNATNTDEYKWFRRAFEKKWRSKVPFLPSRLIETRTWCRSGAEGAQIMIIMKAVVALAHRRRTHTHRWNMTWNTKCLFIHAFAAELNTVEHAVFSAKQTVSSAFSAENEELKFHGKNALNIYVYLFFWRALRIASSGKLNTFFLLLWRARLHAIKVACFDLFRCGSVGAIINNNNIFFLVWHPNPEPPYQNRTTTKNATEKQYGSKLIFNWMLSRSLTFTFFVSIGCVNSTKFLFFWFPSNWNIMTAAGLCNRFTYLRRCIYSVLSAHSAYAQRTPDMEEKKNARKKMKYARRWRKKWWVLAPLLRSSLLFRSN